MEFQIDGRIKTNGSLAIQSNACIGLIFFQKIREDIVRLPNDAEKRNAHGSVHKTTNSAESVIRWLSCLK